MFLLKNTILHNMGPLSFLVKVYMLFFFKL